ncbi:hypothetical protein DXG03_004215 [Asterophora parasitica]|uniref:Uncharacterized protein n=1 Tax=Asterophora parasitica TaxID=117018 RepID=A0A9P7GFE9_9AGAR|nr:hypothetical protein DXG03_004215 [Asterophora parasitica]
MITFFEFYYIVLAIWGSLPLIPFTSPNVGFFIERFVSTRPSTRLYTNLAIAGTLPLLTISSPSPGELLDSQTFGLATATLPPIYPCEFSTINATSPVPNLCWFSAKNTKKAPAQPEAEPIGDRALTADEREQFAAEASALWLRVKVYNSKEKPYVSASPSRITAAASSNFVVVGCFVATLVVAACFGCIESNTAARFCITANGFMVKAFTVLANGFDIPAILNALFSSPVAFDEERYRLPTPWVLIGMKEMEEMYKYDKFVLNTAVTVEVKDTNDLKHVPIAESNTPPTVTAILKAHSFDDEISSATSQDSNARMIEVPTDVRVAEVLVSPAEVQDEAEDSVNTNDFSGTLQVHTTDSTPASPIEALEDAAVEDTTKKKRRRRGRRARRGREWIANRELRKAAELAAAAVEKETTDDDDSSDSN